MVVFNGLQKLTLLDYPGKVACTLFTAGCNLRCPFCHNASLVFRDEELETYSEEDILSFLKKRRGTLDGVAITGGEPLLHGDLPDFLAKVKESGYLVKLDSNGSFPQRLQNVIENGLVDRVAMDVKNCEAKYSLTVGIPDFDVNPIKESITLLKESNIDYEFRTTVTETFHTVEDIAEIAHWLEGAKAYYLQNFVDSGELIDQAVRGQTPEIMHRMVEAAQTILPCTQLRGID